MRDVGNDGELPDRIDSAYAALRYTNTHIMRAGGASNDDRIRVRSKLLGGEGDPAYSPEN